MVKIKKIYTKKNKINIGVCEYKKLQEIKKKIKKIERELMRYKNIQKNELILSIESKLDINVN